MPIWRIPIPGMPATRSSSSPLPGFILGFFLAKNPAETGIDEYYLHLALWTGLSLGVYMTLTRLVWISKYKVSLAFAMAAQVIFYWYAAPVILATIASITHVEFSAQS